MTCATSNARQPSLLQEEEERQEGERVDDELQLSPTDVPHTHDFHAAVSAVVCLAVYWLV